MTPERRRQQIAHGLLVVHDQNGATHAVTSAIRAGRYTENVAPCPKSFSTSIQPPCSRTRPHEPASRRPVPSRTSLVVKNGSKIRGRCSGGIPCPVSCTLACTYSPAPPPTSAGGAACRRSSTTRTLPPELQACSPLT